MTLSSLTGWPVLLYFAVWVAKRTVPLTERTSAWLCLIVTAGIIAHIIVLAAWWQLIPATGAALLFTWVAAGQRGNA